MSLQTGNFREDWCADFARCLLEVRPSLSTREVGPIAERFYDSSYNFEPLEAVQMALQSSLIRRNDRGVSWDEDTTPGIFDRRT